MQNTFEREKKISLEEIIKMVLDDKALGYDKCGDTNVRRLRRAFERLLERLGSNKEVFKQNGVIAFSEWEVPFMKSLLSQLYSNEGIIANFVNSGKKNIKFSSNEVRNFLDILLKEAEKAESDEKKEELEEMGMFFSQLFLWSPLRSVEDCHNLIDSIATYLQDIPINDQSYYLGTIEHILKKEFALRFAEATININGVSQEMG